MSDRPKCETGPYVMLDKDGGCLSCDERCTEDEFRRRFAGKCAHGVPSDLRCIDCMSSQARNLEARVTEIERRSNDSTS